MKINIKYFICLILCCNSFFASSQYVEKHNELSLLLVKDTNLYSILDSVISFEKECEYYNDELYFSIEIGKIPKQFAKWLISIELSENDTNIISLISQEKCDSVYRINIESGINMSVGLSLDPSGYLYYHYHLFIISGNAFDVIFTKTAETKKFKYQELNPYYQRSNDNEPVIILDILDDSFTMWDYWYINNVFIFGSKSGSCVNND